MATVVPSNNQKHIQSDMQRIILDTALLLFTTHGYFNTSVHDIRRHANVSIGSIYHYFKNKEAIAKALFDSVVDKMTCNVEGICAQHTSTHDRCRALIQCLFELADASPETMKYILHAHHREFMPDEKPICSSRPFEMMKQIVEQGIEQGEIRKMKPIVAATSVFGGAIRMIHLMLDGVLEGTVSEHLEEIWQCAWNAVYA